MDYSLKQAHILSEEYRGWNWLKQKMASGISQWRRPKTNREELEGGRGVSLGDDGEGINSLKSSVMGKKVEQLPQLPIGEYEFTKLLKSAYSADGAHVCHIDLGNVDMRFEKIKMEMEVSVIYSSGPTIKFFYEKESVPNFAFIDESNENFICKIPKYDFEDRVKGKIFHTAPSQEVKLHLLVMHDHLDYDYTKLPFIVSCDCYHGGSSGFTIFENIHDENALIRLKSKYMFDPFLSMNQTQKQVIRKNIGKNMPHIFGGVELKKSAMNMKIKTFKPGSLVDFHFLQGKSMLLKGPGSEMPPAGISSERKSDSMYINGK